VWVDYNASIRHQGRNVPNSRKEVSGGEGGKTGGKPSYCSQQGTEKGRGTDDPQTHQRCRGIVSGGRGGTRASWGRVSGGGGKHMMYSRRKKETKRKTVQTGGKRVHSSGGESGGDGELQKHMKGLHSGKDRLMGGTYTKWGGEAHWETR